MGLISSIVKYGAKAINYGKRALNCAPEFVLGESATVIGKGYKSASGSIFTKTKAGLKTFESHVGKLSATKGGFLRRLTKGVLSIPTTLINSAKAGIRLAGMKGTSKFLGCLKGVGKGVAKKMPIIGQLLLIGFEIPNIINGYKKEGITGALKQAGGAGIELGCMAAGSAIGSCFGPGIGTLIGGIVGGIVGMVARNFIAPEISEEPAEQEAANVPEQQDNTAQTPSSDATPSSSSSDSTPESNGSSSTDTSTPTAQNPIGLNPLNPGVSNPFGFSPLNIGFNTNPFGFTGGGLNYTPFSLNPMGIYNPVPSFDNTFLQPGENVFLKYPMGYQFQYIP